MEVEEKADTDDTSKITEKDDPDDIAETAEIDEAEYLEKIENFQLSFENFKLIMTIQFVYLTNLQKPFISKLAQQLRVSSTFHLHQEKGNFWKIFCQVNIGMLLLSQ